MDNKIKLFLKKNKYSNKKFKNSKGFSLTSLMISIFIMTLVVLVAAEVLVVFYGSKKSIETRNSVSTAYIDIQNVLKTNESCEETFKDLPPIDDKFTTLDNNLTFNNFKEIKQIDKSGNITSEFIVGNRYGDVVLKSMNLRNIYKSNSFTDNANGTLDLVFEKANMGLKIGASTFTRELNMSFELQPSGVRLNRIKSCRPFGGFAFLNQGVDPPIDCKANEFIAFQNGRAICSTETQAHNIVNIERKIMRCVEGDGNLTDFKPDYHFPHTKTYYAFQDKCVTKYNRHSKVIMGEFFFNKNSAKSSDLGLFLDSISYTAKSDGQVIVDVTVPVRYFGGRLNGVNYTKAYEGAFNGLLWARATSPNATSFTSVGEGVLWNPAGNPSGTYMADILALGVSFGGVGYVSGQFKVKKGFTYEIKLMVGSTDSPDERLPGVWLGTQKYTDHYMEGTIKVTEVTVPQI